MKKIKILQISRALSLGGTEKTLETLATNLNRNIFEIHVAATHDGGPREKILKSRRIPVRIFKGNWDALRSYIEKNDFDILHLHQVNVPLDILTGRKVILSHHFSENDYALNEEKKFSAVTFNSGHTLWNYLRKNNMKEPELPPNFLILFNPIDTEKLKKTQHHVDFKFVQKTKKTLKISEGDFVVGRLGRADIVKWSDFLLDAVPMMVKLIPNIKIVLQTIPKSRLARIKKSKYKDHFIILPESVKDQDISIFFHLIDVYIHSSKIGESFGVSIAEAMAHKKPVVVNSTPNVDNAQIELVDNGKTGFVVKYPRQFALAVFELYKNKNLRQKMGREGYKKVINNYSAKVILSQYELLLLKLQSQKSPTNLTKKQVRSSFRDYEKRLDNLYGTVDIFDKVDGMVKIPSKFVNRIGDYIEFKKRR